MTDADLKELIAWLESRSKDTPMPGAKRMFKLALDAVREQENDPLSIDELREMDGEPVWTVNVSSTKDGTWEMWDIVEKSDDEGIEFGYSTEYKEWWNYNLRNSDGTLCGCSWLAYRRKKEDA